MKIEKVKGRFQSTHKGETTGYSSSFSRPEVIEHSIRSAYEKHKGKSKAKALHKAKEAPKNKFREERPWLSSHKYD